MTHGTHYDIAMIGGGPAGSTAAIRLARAGFAVCLLERRSFPRETLCGEFLSREVTESIHEIGLSEKFHALRPNPLTSFRLFLGPGRSFTSDLGFSAYGLKRGALDAMLLQGAREAGVSIAQPATVRQIERHAAFHMIVAEAPDGEFTVTASRVIGAYGKRGPLDQPPGPRRPRSPFNGVKFHVPRSRLRAIPEHEIQIFAGRGIYCGLNAVNDEAVTVCFLERRRVGDPPPRRRLIELALAHPELAEVAGPDFESLLEDLPVYGTANIDFGRKDPVRDGVFMIGDAAQVIAPVAGDGIGVAMQSGKMLSELLREARDQGLTSEALERRYRAAWRELFNRRMVLAAGVQRLLLSSGGRAVGAGVLSLFPSLQSWGIRSTRG